MEKINKCLGCGKVIPMGNKYCFLHSNEFKRIANIEVEKGLINKLNL